MSEDKLVREVNLRFKQLNIPFKIRALTGRKFKILENFLKFMNDKELKEFNIFIKEIEEELDNLKRKVRLKRF